MRITTIVLILMLATTAVDAATSAQERYISAIDVSGVSFIYNANNNTVTFISTAETEEKVNELVGKKPVGIEVEVINYQDKGKLGVEISLEEGAELEE